MDKLLSLSRLHVDEAVSTDLLKPRYSSKIAFSMDNSLAETMEETDVSSTSSPPMDQQNQQHPPSPPRGVEATATNIAPPPTVNDAPRGTLPVVKYVVDLAHQLANMECIGSCTAAQLKCERDDDDDLLAHRGRTRAATADLSASNFSQSYRSTDDDTDEYYGDFDDSFYSTFDETIDEDTCTTGPRQLRDQADIARVSRFDDTTTLSSQNSRWL
jgi:hypothetical protein